MFGNFFQLAEALIIEVRGSFGKPRPAERLKGPLVQMFTDEAQSEETLRF